MTAGPLDMAALLRRFEGALVSGGAIPSCSHAARRQVATSACFNHPAAGAFCHPCFLLHAARHTPACAGCGGPVGEHIKLGRWSVGAGLELRGLAGDRRRVEAIVYPLHACDHCLDAIEEAIPRLAPEGSPDGD